MNDEDLHLRDRLLAIADDAPVGAAVRACVQGGYLRTLRRRRWYAAGSVAAVVLVVTGAATLLGPGPVASPHEVSALSVTSTLGPRSAASTTALDSRSQLEPAPGSSVTSPVYVPTSWVSFDQDPPDLESSPTSLHVSWVEHEPFRTNPTDPGSAEVGQYRGYTITTTQPPLQVRTMSETINLHTVDVTVNGHPGRLVTVPTGADPMDEVPHDPVIIWQLNNGHWISVFSGGTGDPDLPGFASAIQDVPTTFPPDISIGLTLKGFISRSSTSSSFVSQVAGPRMMLCRPSPAPNDAGCLTVSAMVADGGFGASIVMGDESNAAFVAQSVRIDVGGIQVRVNARYQASWTRWGTATILVQSSDGVTVSAADLAALAASVRLAPTLGVKDQPNAIVESSQLRQSAAAAAQARSTR
jgi:hypothetical protein